VQRLTLLAGQDTAGHQPLGQRGSLIWVVIRSFYLLFRGNTQAQDELGKHFIRIDVIKLIGHNHSQCVRPYYVKPILAVDLPPSEAVFSEVIEAPRRGPDLPPKPVSNCLFHTQAKGVRVPHPNPRVGRLEDRHLHSQRDLVFSLWTPAPAESWDHGKVER
jgi:hypothetical protein